MNFKNFWSLKSFLKKNYKNLHFYQHVSNDNLKAVFSDNTLIGEIIKDSDSNYKLIIVNK
jgi:hypothetical protein